jgi:hypothetical protein
MASIGQLFENQSTPDTDHFSSLLGGWIQSLYTIEIHNLRPKSQMVNDWTEAPCSIPNPYRVAVIGPEAVLSVLFPLRVRLLNQESLDPL